ncbi:hypothetical protein HanXRQr2_Chr08g0328471 [Helianthus annuus]|uniref:Uncharacterized protein n=1 Tax=Helianthus annuus TaxID=4232 RepID=A0A9K3ID19_HELAN|nr:hypothetical protein HanXRQr2_Chr08g0328471 [Helianthus annuus]
MITDDGKATRAKKSGKRVFPFLKLIKEGKAKGIHIKHRLSLKIQWMIMILFSFLTLKEQTHGIKMG